MILSFKKQFIERIIRGSKIHTIRLDPHNRWKVDNKIHFATGIRTKKYNQFFEGECKSIQKIKIIYKNGKHNHSMPSIYVDNKLLKISEMIKLAHNDGFDLLYQFIEWFNKDFEGKIIHWTNFKY